MTLSVSDRININYGLRANLFTSGTGNFYTYDSSGNAIDTATYSSGQVVKNYFNLEPRFSMSWKLTAVSSMKAGVYPDHAKPASAFQLHVVQSDGCLDTQQQQCPAGDRRPGICGLFPEF
jgi:hypothetical protein